MFCRLTEKVGPSLYATRRLEVVDEVSNLVSSVGTTVALPSQFRWALQVLTGLGNGLAGLGDLQKATETLLRSADAGLLVAQMWQIPLSIRDAVPETTWGLGVQRGMLQLLPHAWSWQVNCAGCQ